MLSYLSSIFRYFFPDEDVVTDEDKEDFLAEQLLQLEAESTYYKDNNVQNNDNLIPKDAVCFQKKGVITFMGESFILINGMFYYDTSCCNIPIKIGDKVLYMGYKDANDSVTIVRVLENQGIDWGEPEEDEKSFEVTEHVIVGEVEYREDRFVYIKDGDLKFNLDDVEATFVPVLGDYLELTCNIQHDKENPSNISPKQVIQVKSFKAVRTTVVEATVTRVNGDEGICDRKYYLNKKHLQNVVSIQVGAKMLIEAIESNQKPCAWRVIKLIPLDTGPQKEMITSTNVDCDSTLELEKNKNIKMTHPLKFEKVLFDTNATITLDITNNSEIPYVINKWIIPSKKRDSQITVKPFIAHPRNVYPQETISFTITLHPVFLGESSEQLIIMFKGFQLRRHIDIEVINENVTRDYSHGIEVTHDTSDKKKKMIEIRKKAELPYIPGIKINRTPNFVHVRISPWAVPNKAWAAVLGDSEQIIYGSDFEKVLTRIERHYPCLLQDLNIGNYVDRWHTLIYLEEIQTHINMRRYDQSKAFLVRCQEYLGLEIKDVAELRPSLLLGDRVVVKDVWNADAPYYEGFIHEIKGDFVLMKFSPAFHQSYSGSDVTLEFHSGRMVFRRAHHAISLALSNLGPSILFPTRVSPRPPRVRPHTLQNIKWFNTELNPGQKAAVRNIILAECRPLPYCIYGPPGTGKTMTVIETILQILTLLPDSRILVATPSNSSANLITERLIKYKDKFSGSIVRLLAKYLVNSENIPEAIKRYCATFEIAREGTIKSNQQIDKNGMTLNCQANYVSRYRVIISTCNCVGVMFQMDLPRGHFTHVVIDEAGQACEPEALIPITFINKDSGQVILAGDPMQLGPIIMSRYCTEYNMQESFLSRILDSFPYQKDYDAFPEGYDKRLVTRLTENYRSVAEVLKLPSEMFYDGMLIPKIDISNDKIVRSLSAISTIFNSPDSNCGGIFVYGIRGTTTRAADSPSWLNTQEASMVALTACKLFKNHITEEEIGVITPYIAQAMHLRLLFDAMGLPKPKIGTVEEFQGQERPIVLISTVRANKIDASEHRQLLGFLNNPKRLNVALTRAQAAVILFCDPYLLCLDPLWKKVIMNAVNTDKYMGCDFM